jgi:hypothetical protein
MRQLSVKRRADSLARMTLEEKIAQLKVSSLSNLWFSEDIQIKNEHGTDKSR